MQNIDYSRRLRSPGTSYSQESPQGYSSPVHSHSYSSFPSSESNKSKSAFVLLIGAILLFTSGMVVGIQLNQKEKGFQSNQEKSFSNVGKSERAEKNDRKAFESKESEATTSREESTGSNESSPFPSSLKFPPKNDQINYMVQIGNFSPEEAVQVGKHLMTSEPSLQGRIFRTSTGKLYAGYFYRMEDAKEALEKITTRIPSAQTEALVKTIRF
ncbi:hypothetical protein LPTSP3_g07010 [Leptospira kobayashii]|uniref:Sporulation and cell division repeat protein n=1 Tax=Leptospira kobayashii TaxID=1917830 RepID=A0ABN6KAH3_9LEPT|nr:hypothetical protein [Leptospira kobayashii]BDA77771.1 hypothetical protein LPTSP3_g07010 [Leptospira kobayashii]